MKKTIAMLLAILMMLSLTACGECKHEQWTPADCVSPATCAECGITEGEALGHTWQEATCSAPETCYSCGETQGETLPHTYGAWEIGESDMSHACTVCGESETMPLDHEVAVKSLMEGRWNFLYLKAGDNTLDTYAGNPASYLVCSDDGSGKLYIPQAEATEDDFHVASISESSFIISAVVYNSDVQAYNFFLTFDDGSNSAAQIYLNDNGSYQFTVLVDENNYMIFTKNTREDAYYAGTWASAEDGEFKTLILNEDGTLGGDYEGTWHSKAIINANGVWYSGFSIIYKDGEAYGFADGLSYLCSAEYFDINDYLKQGYNDGITLYVGIGKSWDIFDKLSAEEYEQVKKANEEGKDLVVGTWTCSTASYHNSSSGETVEVAGEYSMVFNADGTVNSVLADTVDGTWSFRGAEMNGNEINYLFDVILGQNDTYVRLMADGRLLASSMLANDGLYYSYTFDRN